MGDKKVSAAKREKKRFKVLSAVDPDSPFGVRDSISQVSCQLDVSVIAHHLHLSDLSDVDFSACTYL